MKSILGLTVLLMAAGALAAVELQTGPPLPHKLVEDWAKPPKGM